MKDIKEMSQLRSAAFSRHQKKERLGTNTDKTSATYETIKQEDMQQKNHLGTVSWKKTKKNY